MTDFPQLAQDWLSEPFPRGTPVDYLDEIRAELAWYDAWIADTLLPYVNKGIFVADSPDGLDVLGCLEDLSTRLHQFQATGPNEADAVQRYTAYIGLLTEVYTAFLEVRSRGVGSEPQSSKDDRE